MIFLKHRNKRYQLPTKPEEIDLWQYMAMVAVTSQERYGVADLLSAFTGLPKEVVYASDGNADTFNFVLDSMAPAIQSWLNAPPAKYIEVGGYKYAPKAWELNTLGQRIAMLQILEEGKPMERANEILAIVLAYSRWGKQWSDHYELLADELKYVPASIAVPMCAFFLGKLSNTRPLLTRVSRFLLTRITKGREAKKWPFSAL